MNRYNQRKKNKKENPPYYKIDHKLAVLIWEVLLEEGWIDLERSLSRIMIDQGCKGIEKISPNFLLIQSQMTHYILLQFEGQLKFLNMN